MSYQGDDGDVGPRGLPGEPVSVSKMTQLILFSLRACLCIFFQTRVNMLHLKKMSHFYCKVKSKFKKTHVLISD